MYVRMTHNTVNSVPVPVTRAFYLVIFVQGMPLGHHYHCLLNGEVQGCMYVCMYVGM